MATPGQWIPPLPPGYEARWDPNQRAYFFINHHDKSTTWVDPRFAPGMHKPPQQQQHAAAAQFLNPKTGNTGGGHSQNVQMSTMLKQFGSTTSRDSGSSDDDLWGSPEDFDKLFASSSDKKVDLMKLHEIKQSFPSAPEDLIKSLLEKHGNNVVKTTNELFNKGYKREAVSHPPPRKVDMLERLKAMFPTVDSGLVEDMLSVCDNDEKKTREQLESMGYTAKFPATHRNPSARARNRKTSPAKTRSPAKELSPIRKRSPSPAKPKLSESEKQSLCRKFQNQFKDMEKSVVEMALQVCDYDEERAKNVLGRMESGGDSSPPPTSSRPSTSKARSPSPAPVEPASLEPVSLFDDRPGSSTSTSKSSPSRGSTPAVKKSSDSASRPSTGKTSSRTPSPKKTTSSHHSQQHRAKQVTHRSQGHNVVARQPQARQVYVSQYRTEAKGPDPSLRVGPNKGLLLSEYTSAKGPNPELRQGPDPSRVQGTQGAMGPDRSLHCGPQLDLRSGPSSENLLVTAI